jgi:hypothetical protein
MTKPRSTRRSATTTKRSSRTKHSAQGAHTLSAARVEYENEFIIESKMSCPWCGGHHWVDFYIFGYSGALSHSFNLAFPYRVEQFTTEQAFVDWYDPPLSTRCHYYASECTTCGAVICQ